MQKPTPKIVFFDIDETLYIKAEKRIPRSIFEQVIPRLKAKGIVPAIATGRGRGAFPAALQPLLNENGFELCVTINGQHNSFCNQIISQYPLTTERIEQVIADLNRLGIAYGLISDTDTAVSADAPHVKTSLSPIKADYLIDPELYKRQPIYQMLAFYPPEQEATVLASGVLGDDLKIVRWHPLAVDLLNTHHSKAMGIRDVLAYFDVTIDDVMAFGDGLNDIEMLESVGFGVAMGNGEAELKAVADYVTLPIEQDGILHALEQLGVI